MTERPDTPDERDVLLAAWLDGELDEVTDRRVRAWLDTDPALAARLAAIHDTVVALSGVDDVEPPAGYEARLGARLDDERAARPPGPRRSAPHRRRLARLSGAAAALVGVAVLGAGILTVSVRTGADRTAGTDESARRPGAAGLSQDAGPGRGPVPLVDARARVSGPDALRRRYTAIAQGAARTAGDQTPAGRRAGPRPHACPDELGARDVVVRVEPILYAGRPGLAYVTVDARDRTRVTVVAADGCVPLADIALTGRAGSP